MTWLVVGVLVGVVLLAIPFPFNVAIGGGLLLGALMWIIDLLMQIGTKLKALEHSLRPDPDPEAVIRQRARAERLAPKGKYRPK